MAIVHFHMRFLWGAFDADAFEATSPSYDSTTDYANLGPSASPGAGIGCRRATLLFDRQLATPADDAMLMHFDFLNITAGDPDDTWTTSDYTTLEGLLVTWWSSLTGKADAFTRLSRILWHRVGPGIPDPNPATRILDISSPTAGSATRAVPPQVASSITFRTGMRAHWGRTYFPLCPAADSNGRVSTSNQAALVTPTVTLFHSAQGADFFPVVLSTKLNSALGIEAVEADDVYDIVRRRRWKHTVTRNVTSL